MRHVPVLVGLLLAALLLPCAAVRPLRAAEPAKQPAKKLPAKDPAPDGPTVAAAKPSAPNPAPGDPAPPASPADDKARSSGVTVSLVAADLRAVVNALARAHNINMVGSDKLTGRVTLHLNNAPVLEALDVILKNAGFALVQRESGIYEVLTQAESLRAANAQEKPKIEVFSLQFADVEETAKLLVPNILPDATSVTLDAASNRLIISATEAQLAKVRQLIAAVDKPVPKVRVFELKYKTVEEAAKLLVPNAIPDEKSVSTDAASSRLIVSGTPEQLKRVEQILLEVDRPVPQVAITAKIVEIYTDRAKSRGLAVDLIMKSGSGDNGRGVFGFDVDQDPVAAATFDFAYLSDRIDASLSALVQKEAAEVLSEPKVATSHNRKAQIKVVNQVPVITRTTRIVDQVTVTDEEVTFKETGLTLEVTPRVLAENKIEMLVKPAVLELTGWTETDPPAPIIDTRSAETNVTISDGKWLVIGGLIRYNERTVERGIPLLMDIPILGWLFRSTYTVREKSNLVILVTATVLDAEKIDQEAEGVRSAIRKHRKDHDLHGGPFPPRTSGDKKDADAKAKDAPQGADKPEEGS